MTSEYLTIAEMEKITGISNSNIRRYIANFDSFFVAKGGSRIKKYEAAAVDILKRIRSLYEEGLDTQEIHNILVNEFPLVVNGEGQEGQAHTVPTLATSKEVAKIGDDIAEIKKVLEEQRQFNQALLQSNQLLLQQREQDRKFFEQRFEEIQYDRQFLYSLREGMNQRKLEIAAAKEEPMTNSDEQEETVKKADEEAVTISEEVTNNKEESTVKNSEEAIKASKEAVTASEQVATAATQEVEKPKKKKGFLSWLFGE